MVLRIALRPILAALAAILAGLTLAASAIAVADGGGSLPPGAPGNGCPPIC